MHEMTDDEREALIEYYLDEMQTAVCSTSKRMWWVKAAKEINARSPERVKRMEREQGLCTPS